MKYLSWKVIQILACCLACPSLRILPEKALIPSVLSPLHRTTKILALARVRDFQILAISPISAILAILLPPPLPPGGIPVHPRSSQFGVRFGGFVARHSCLCLFNPWTAGWHSRPRLWRFSQSRIAAKRGEGAVPAEPSQACPWVCSVRDVPGLYPIRVPTPWPQLGFYGT